MTRWWHVHRSERQVIVSPVHALDACRCGHQRLTWYVAGMPHWASAWDTQPAVIREWCDYGHEAALPIVEHGRRR